MSGDKGIRRKVGAILDSYGREPEMLIPILQDIQAEYNYLPQEALRETSDGLAVPLSRVFSVATFFKAFSLEPRGRHSVHVCMGTACHVRGAVRILESIERELCIKSGETTKDLGFTLETVNCVGACALGPIAIVDGEFFGQMTIDRVKPLLESYD